MWIILSSLKWQSALVNLDDIANFSKTVEQHLNHLQSVLTLLRDAGVTVNLKSYSFFAATINYSGQIICPNEIKESTTYAVRPLQDLATQTKIWSLLGLCNVFRQFASNFSRVAVPLRKMLCKYQPRSFPSSPSKKRSGGALKEPIEKPASSCTTIGVRS